MCVPSMTESCFCGFCPKAGLRHISFLRKTMVEQSPIASFMTRFMGNPSSPPVLPVAALLILSLPVFAGKKYRPESCFCGKIAKTGPGHRRNAQKSQRILVISDNEHAKDGGQKLRPPSGEMSFFPMSRVWYVPICRPAAAPPAAHSAGEHPDTLSGCRRNPLPACCRCGCCDPSPSPR